MRRWILFSLQVLRHFCKSGSDAKKKMRVNIVPKKVAINGFGRVGRAVFRAWLSRLPECEQKGLELVAINDPVQRDHLLYLLKYDSTHGTLNSISSTMMEKIIFSQNKTSHNWGELNIDWVVDCSGAYRRRALAEQHLIAGAKKVLIGAPAFDEIDFTALYGVNHQKLLSSHKIISAGSCTANALAVLCQPLVNNIQQALFTEMHAFTMDQNLVDGYHPDPRRGRAAAHNMIPTGTAAPQCVATVLPELIGRIQGYSMRVPTLNVACLDLTIKLTQPLSLDAVKELYRQQARVGLKHVLATQSEALVSSDFNGSYFSAVVDETQMRVMDDLVKIIAWYDNETGYAHRLLDLILLDT